MERVTFDFEAIHFHDNVYIVRRHQHAIEYDEKIDGTEDKAWEDLWLKESEIMKNAVITTDHDDHATVNLLGGRIRIEFNSPNFMLKVDGINISLIDNEFYHYYKFNIHELAYYLNAISVYGVDEFLANYKKTVENWIQKVQLQLDKNIENYQKYREDDELQDDRHDTIDKLQALLKRLFSLLLLLDLHYPLGIENEKIMEVVNYFDKMFGYI